MSEGKKYWAFISYSSKDRKWGQWLHRRMENYLIPSDFRGKELFDGAVLGKSLRPVFRDRDELSGSADLGGAIHEALAGSHFLVVLCSKNSAPSRWVNQEIEDFQKQGKGDRILALILDGEPNAANPEEECFPPSLRYPAEPIAGDLRKEGDGKARGFLKILAGITQVGFDDLYRRHERNMARKRTIIGCIAFGLIIFFSVLSTYAWLQKKIAEEQRDVAIERKNEVLRAVKVLNYDIGNALLDYVPVKERAKISAMVDSLLETVINEESTGIERKEKVVSLFNKVRVGLDCGADPSKLMGWALEANRLISKVAADNPDDELVYSLLIKSYMVMGDVQKNMRDLDSAQKSYEEALMLTGSFLTRSDYHVSPEYLAIHGNISWRLGDVAYRRGEISTAREHYLMAMGARQQLLDDEPDNPDFRRALSPILQCLGDLELEEGNTDKGARFYKLFRDNAEYLIEVNPDHLLHNKDMIICYFKYAELMKKLGDNEAALENYKKALSFIEKITYADPNDLRTLTLQVKASDVLGESAFNQGDMKSAYSYYNKLVNASIDLERLQPDNISYKKNTVGALFKVGKCVQEDGDEVKLFSSKRLLLEPCRAVIAAEPDNENYLKISAQDHTFVGDVIRETKGLIDAKPYYEHGYSALLQLSRVSPDPTWKRELIRYNWRMVLLMESLNLSQEGIAYAQRGLDLIRVLQEAGALDEESACKIPEFEERVRKSNI